MAALARLGQSFERFECAWKLHLALDCLRDIREMLDRLAERRTERGAATPAKIATVADFEALVRLQ
jgi:hypothetical protein